MAEREENMINEILKKMNRRGSREELTSLIKKIRAKIPDVVLRTTFITGFPGESEEQFESLAEFICAAKDNNRNVFAAELTDSAMSLSDCNISPKDIFIIGNEGHGISKEYSSLCTRSVFIPISKKTESLNASVAAAAFPA